MKPPFPSAAWVWLAVVGVASFLTWAALGAPSLGFPLGGFSVSVNAWSGSLTLMGILFPNWLTVLAAFGAAGVTYARANGAQLSPALPRGLMVYAIAHVALFSFFVWGNGNSFGRGTLGVGAILMLVALVGLWRTLATVSTAPAPVSPSEVDLEY